MKTQITKVIETIEVRDSHIAWCVRLWISEHRAREVKGKRQLGTSTLNKKAHIAVAESLGVTPGDVVLAVHRHYESNKDEG
jgi:hypothetical protein